MSARGAAADELEGLRAELEGIDRSIILLLGERIRTARRAIAVRRHGGDGVTDAVQEARVLRRARLLAEAFGVPVVLAERLWETLIEAGKMPAHPTASSAPVVTIFVEAPSERGPSRPRSRPLLVASRVAHRAAPAPHARR